jgi:uncharacterized protein involved in exopolysaccharide biosynthesis
MMPEQVDVVARLHDEARRFRDGPSEQRDLCVAAAAELTTLRAEKAHMQDVLDSYRGTYTREKERAEAAEAKLQEAERLIWNYVNALTSRARGEAYAAMEKAATALAARGNKA